MREDDTIAVVKAQGETSRFELGLDRVFLVLSPSQGDDLGVVLPRLFGENGRDEKFQV
jgi:hypothetical protein